MGEVRGGMPIVVLPVGSDDDALDACLAALDASTPAGTRVWLADDACAGPRGYAIIERWMARTALKADYTRRQRSVGEVVHLDQALAACSGMDVVVLAPDAVPLPGWLERMSSSLQADGAMTVRWPGGERAFADGERLHTENSYKWTPEAFEALLREAGFGPATHWTDARGWFSVFWAPVVI